MAYENYIGKTNVKSIYIEVQEEETISKINIEESIEVALKNTSDSKKENWKVEIPKIGLSAPIAEGTSQEVMREYVGHFEASNFWKGNVGLAAHNKRISNKLF